MMSGGAYKERHQAMKLEEIFSGQEYAFTLNPSDGIGKNELLSAYCEKHTKALREILDEVELSIYPELSPTGKVHFHGTIKILDLYTWGRKVGTLCEFYAFCMKPIVDTAEEVQKELECKYASWYDYCTKQDHIVKKWAPNHYPIKLEIKKDKLDIVSAKSRKREPDEVRIRDISKWT